MMTCSKEITATAEAGPKSPATLGPVLTVHPSRRGDKGKPSGKMELWKRALDLTCLAVLSPVAVVVMLIIAGFIKVVSPGPVFYRQERVGYRRKHFCCLKFRTMKVGADTTVHQRHLKTLLQTNAPMVKIESLGDPRLIRFGALLRATGLDELPQLINVLRGEMSLVGPRPCTPYELENYLPWQYARFDALPGLTGLWQVSGKNRTTFTEMIHLDIYYAHHKSLWMDLAIVAATFGAIFQQVADLRRTRPSDRNKTRHPYQRSA